LAGSLSPVRPEVGISNALTGNDDEGIFGAMKLERLREVLEEAERRKEAELRSTGRKASLVIGIPAAALLVWAGAFLIQHRASGNAAPDKPVPAERVAEPAKVPQGGGEIDSFLPAKAAGGKPAKGGAVVDHEDIRFAMELLNFGGSPAAPKEGKK
jgi:hypothetical protein